MALLSVIEVPDTGTDAGRPLSPEEAKAFASLARRANGDPGYQDPGVAADSRGGNPVSPFSSIIE